MVQRASDLHWIRPPRQERTHQSPERLLDGAESMLLEKGFDGIHVSEIANRADTSVARHRWHSRHLSIARE